MKWMAAAGAVVVLAMGCSGSEPSIDGPDASSESNGEEIETPAESTSSSTTTTVADALETTDVLATAGIMIVELQAPSEGPHRELVWSPVEGATRYLVALKTEDGRAYWAWEGEASSVRVGGGDRDDLNQTAAVLQPLWWSLTAVDADGRLVAYGPPVRLDP